MMIWKVALCGVVFLHVPDEQEKFKKKKNLSFDKTEPKNESNNGKMYLLP